MGKKATKAADNMYCIARYEAAEENEVFSSREKASEMVNIDRTRLANIELGNIIPYPEEVLSLANSYNTPELCNQYCSCQCPIGKTTVKQVKIDDFDRLTLKVLGSLEDIDSLRSSLISISQDGEIDVQEQDEFNNILSALDKISTNAKALSLWAQKNIKVKANLDTTQK